jgi:hypothetical protein
MKAITWNLMVMSTLMVLSARADDHPSPGMTMRTNSTACIAKHKSMHDLLSSYFNGMPAMSTLKRIDILTGGVLVNSATSAMPTGKLKTQLYSIASTYGSDPIGTLSGKQTISEDYYSNNWIVSSMIKLYENSGITVSINTNHYDCNLASLANELNVGIRKRFNLDGSSFSGSVILQLDSNSNSKICADPNKKILDLIIEEKNRLEAIPTIELGNSITVESIDTEAELAVVANGLANTSYDAVFPNYYGNYELGSILLFVNSENYAHQEPLSTQNNSNYTLEDKQKDVRNKLRRFLYNRKNQLATKAFAAELSNSPVFKNTTLGNLCTKAK